MPEGFRVARPLLARAGTATSARATFAGTAPLGTIGPIAGVEVHVALGYWPEDYADVTRWDTALWDTAASIWDVTAPPLTDVSCDVLAYSSRLGRDRPLERFRTGTCTVTLDDPEGLYSPWSTATADPPTFGAIRPGIELHVWVETAGGTWPRFVGRVTSITDNFPDTDERHTVTFEAADYSSLLAAYDGFEQPPTGAGECSGARLHRICDEAAYPYPRAFDTGGRTLAPTTLAGTAWDEAGMVCDTELGVLFSDRAGVLVHRDEAAMVTDPLYTDVQAVFGEVEPELCYSRITLVADTDKLKNVVSIAREGGVAYTVDAPESRAMYGTHTYRRFDLIHDSEAESPLIAQHHLDVYAYAANRIESLGIDVHVRPDQLEALLDLGLLYQIEVRRRAEGFQPVAELQIQAITESITPDEWTLDLTTFSAASIFDAGRWDIAGDVWDTALWAY